MNLLHYIPPIDIAIRIRDELRTHINHSEHHKTEEHPGQLTRACVELAKAWRTDKYLRRLEAVLLVADKTRYCKYASTSSIYKHVNICIEVFILTSSHDSTFELTGNGDVLEPEVGVMGVGSGGTYALAAALV